MEKRKPTYDLEAFKAAAGTLEGLNATGSAIRGAAAIGFRRREIVATIRPMPTTRSGRMSIMCRRRRVSST
jgi:motility quorum-sensing regulator/GCU-specific mRNA interferase toxin